MDLLRIHPSPAVYIADWPRSHNTLLLREIVDDYIQVSHNIQEKKMARYILTLVNSVYVSRKHLYVFGNG